jgi:DNA-binding response OmpR family regulator
MPDPKAKILVIDDDPDVLFSLNVVLESGGYTVVTASDAREGLQAFKESKPDVVIVDLMMEEVDSGTRLIREIQDLDRKVPIYMLSSTGDYLYSNLDVNEMGVAGVFQKPLNPTTLLNLLSAKLKSRGSGA